MKIVRTRVPAYGVKFVVKDKEKVVGRATVFIMTNDLHDKPFALLEDVFVDENYRGQRIGHQLLKKVMNKVRELGCYKLIATSRFERGLVHEWYKRLGFKCHGYEFRMDFE